VDRAGVGREPGHQPREQHLASRHAGEQVPRIAQEVTVP
jgi:hypothetical protein